MTLYQQTTTNLALWPEPIEIGYQLLGGGDGSALAPKLNHLGIATWLEDVFDISRPTLYSLPRRMMEQLAGAQPIALRDKQVKAAHQIEVNATRLQRTILTAAFPGKMALRPL